MSRACTVTKEGRGRRGRKKRMVKCSSCKIMKPSRDFKPIVVNGKKVIPKTCQLCRSRRTEYYWKYECREARELGIRPPSKHHSEIPSVDPIHSHVEKEESSPLDDTQSVDSTHLLEDESSTLSSTTLSPNEATVGDGENSPVTTDYNNDLNGILDDNDNFILADDGILDGLQYTAMGGREEPHRTPDSLRVSYALSMQEDPMNLSQQDVYSFNWEPFPFLSGNDSACDNDYPFTSFSIPFENKSVY